MKNTEHMTLIEHISQLRIHLLLACAGIALMSACGWFAVDAVMEYMTRPALNASVVAATSVGAGFDLRIRVSLWIGCVLASPWVLLQLWLFIAPGLYKKEKIYALSFLFASIIFAGIGVILGVWTAPRAVKVLLNFSPASVSNILDVHSYMLFYMRVVLLFMLFALIPVIFVAANFLGVVRARTLLSHWRIALMVCATGAAIANPLPSVASMLIQAVILFLLWLIAVGVCFLREFLRKRKASPAARVY